MVMLGVVSILLLSSLKCQKKIFKVRYSMSIKCNLCGSMIEPDGFGWDRGHNPWPLRMNEDDRCCQTCNDTVVVPTRIRMLSAKKKREGLDVG